MTSIRYCIIILAIAFTNIVSASEKSCSCDVESEYCTDTKLNFIENKGQWDDRIEFDCELGGLNHVFLEKDAFTYVIYDNYGSSKMHEELQKRAKSDNPYFINGHTYSVKFLGASTESFQAEFPRKAYNNYFLGNDPTKWASEVSVYQRVTYNNIYSGIDLVSYAETGDFKYDFIVQPQANPEKIQLKYTGVDAVCLVDGDLSIETSIGKLMEIAPYAYQIINGKTSKITCNYVLKDNVLSFEFPDGYNENVKLVIDPTVVGATLSGTTQSRNFGHSATFDNEGNVYVGGISFGEGYPVTTGAFQTNFGGGQNDIIVSKYNHEGTDLIYATYIGGDDEDYPHSMVANQEQELYIYGNSESEDYPVTSNAYQTIQAGNSDIIVTKLNIDGTALLASTFIGGDAGDGRNINSVDDSYGDEYRGEIVLDGNSNVYVCSSTLSDDFPTTAGAFQQTFVESGSPDQDGVVFKMNSSLTDLEWSTYLGGSDIDACFGIRLRSDGSIYVSGFAGEDDFPMPAGGAMSWPGGGHSAFVVNLSADGSQLLNGTFWGSDDEDQGFFIDIDELGQLHLYGVTDGEPPISQGTYFLGLESHQFFVGFSSNLNNVVYSTVFGNGDTSGSSETPHSFVPVAFMVDKCNYIYFSGYYAEDGLPVSSDGFYTEGNSFYLGVFEPEATGLFFSTYFGRANHVDGGTSRFDKSGVVYQAVCSCMTGDRILNTTSGAWAESQTEDCDAGVFILDFESPTVVASAFADPGYIGCAPYVVDFEYTGNGADSVYWNFGTGDSITAFNPTYTFTEPGTYIVQQIAENLELCNIRDTFYLEIQVFANSSSSEEIEICPSQQSLILDSGLSEGVFFWNTGETTPTIEITMEGVYWVDIMVGTCFQRDSFIISTLPPFSIELGADQVICDQTSIDLNASNPDAVSYVWNTGDEVPILEVTESGEYSVLLTTEEGCLFMDTINIILSTTPIIDFGDDIMICDGEPVDLITGFSGLPHVWQDGSEDEVYTALDQGIYSVTVNNEGCEGVGEIEITYLPTPDVSFESSNISCNGEEDGTIQLISETGGTSFNYSWDSGDGVADLADLEAGSYTVTVTNEFDCETIQTFDIVEPLPLSYVFNPQSPSCSGLTSGLIEINQLSGGTPPYTIQLNGNPPGIDTSFADLDAGFYTVIVEDSQGCFSVDTFTVIELDVITIDAGEDQTINLGESTDLTGTASDFTNTTFFWSPPNNLSCVNCTDPEANPFVDTEYVFTVTDSMTNCVYMDTVLIRVNRDKNIFVPNVFSPNNDGINDFFSVFTDASVAQINEIRIYSRWGELIWLGENILPNNPQIGWDGSFKGRPMNPQIVAYMLEVLYVDGETEILSGSVTIIK